MPLTDTVVRNAKHGTNKPKLTDGNGLYLLLSVDGGKRWRFDYRRPLTGKRNTLSLGIYPEVSLRDARDRLAAARKQLAEGVDPGEQRKADKHAARIAAGNSFETIATEWMDTQRAHLAQITRDKTKWGRSTYVFPTLGARPIAEITSREVLAALRAIEGSGIRETTHRTKRWMSAVFCYAIATDRAEIDPTAALRNVLKPVVSTPRAAIIDPTGIAGLLRAIDGFGGQPTTAAALRLAPLTFVRPGELRGAEWAEIDLDGAEWRIPAHRMKMRDEHVVPLSRQAVAVLRGIHMLTGAGRYVFPSLRSGKRSMSENTVNAALRRLGYGKEEMTGHGFRAMASSRLNEMGFPPDVIERQLAHAEPNKVRAVYNRAQYLPERRKMMQAWSDYLDGLKAGGNNVVALHRKTA